MALLIAAFHKYSGKEGDKHTLSKGELKDLLKAELGDIFGKCEDKAALDKIFKDLDANADGVVDFQEYVTLIACITMLCNDSLKKESGIARDIPGNQSSIINRQPALIFQFIF
ncbi:ictacalcin-like isoform X2 [Chanodichthys erythropterus]